MLQFRHQTKQLCVVDVAHSIHLILGSSDKPIEVTPANPPNSLSTHRSKLDLPPLLLGRPPTHSLTVAVTGLCYGMLRPHDVLWLR